MQRFVYEGGGFCPVCRRSALDPARFRRLWKCRLCGTRIPDAAFLVFVPRLVQELGARAGAVLPALARRRGAGPRLVPRKWEAPSR